MSGFWMTLRRFWCRFAHARPGWPVYGHYTCHKCGLTHPVKWDGLAD